MAHFFDRSQWWAGAVRERAHRWAEAVFKRTAGRVPWPELGGQVALHARRAIVDVVKLSEEGEAQVRACWEMARERYEELRGGDGQTRG